MKKIGIDSYSFYIPKIYLPIETLALERNIEVDKLKNGLGIHKISMLDMHEDTATMAANALLQLIQKENINPKEIGRIYLATESSLDAAKPTVSYVIELVEQFLEPEFGKRNMKNVDAVDFTFACVAGVDVLQNTLDFVRCNPSKIGIVICSDYAKYSLASPGEYTQGAGAVCFSITSNPSILSFENNFGIGFKSEHDFFKPRHKILSSSLNNTLESENKYVEIFSDEPIYDGHFSNECYKSRIEEAYFNFKEIKSSHENLLENWNALVFHLPFSYQGRKSIVPLFLKEFCNDFFIKNILAKNEFANENILQPSKSFLKELVNTDEFKSFIELKVKPCEQIASEVGNVYTASVFMAMLSSLMSLKHLNNGKIGFLSYGSGSKSKVFEGELVENWQAKIDNNELSEKLNNRKALTFDEYYNLHTKKIENSILKPSSEFVLDSISENGHLPGLRNYSYHF